MRIHGHPEPPAARDRLPALIDVSMRNKLLLPYRERVTAAAEGRVLDVGVGSGLSCGCGRGGGAGNDDGA